MMRLVACVLSLALLTGCTYRIPLYIKEFAVRPDVVGHGGHFSIRLWGAEVADYRFMGAVRQSDGSWTMRIDPVWMGLYNQESSITVREGDTLPLGPGPSVLVEFTTIAPTEIGIRAVGVHTIKDRR